MFAVKHDEIYKLGSREKKGNHSDKQFYLHPLFTHSSLASPLLTNRQRNNVYIYVKIHTIICADIHIYVCTSDITYTLTFKHTNLDTHTDKQKKINHINQSFMKNPSLSDEYVKHKNQGHRHNHVFIYNLFRDGLKK